MRTHLSRRNRAAAGATAAVLGVAVALGSGLAGPAFAADPATLSSIVLGVGANETQRIVNWYSSADTAQQVQVAPTEPAR